MDLDFTQLMSMKEIAVELLGVLTSRSSTESTDISGQNAKVCSYGSSNDTPHFIRFNFEISYSEC